MTKQNSNQSGFAHLVIITAVLGVAVVGLLGYVFWQNYMRPKESNNNVAVTTDDTNNSANTPDTDSDISTPVTTPTNPNEGYLVLSDWDVKFKLPTNLGTNRIEYEKGDSYTGFQTYYFSTTRVKQLGDLCANGKYGGFLMRGENKFDYAKYPMSPPEYLKKIDNYYYYYGGPQDVCSNNSREMQLSDFRMITSMIQGVEKE